MQPTDDVYIGHMLDVVKKIMAKTGSISREQFDADENLRLALTHLLQTIGEATRRISRELQAEHPEVPWAAIIGMRHKVVHDYMGVEEEVVWRTARDEVPRLHAALQKLGIS
jgi:uncharacterized protein with HEPN domain